MRIDPVRFFKFAFGAAVAFYLSVMLYRWTGLSFLQPGTVRLLADLAAGGMVAVVGLGVLIAVYRQIQAPVSATPEVPLRGMEGARKGPNQFGRFGAALVCMALAIAAALILAGGGRISPLAYQVLGLVLAVCVMGGIFFLVRALQGFLKAAGRRGGK